MATATFKESSATETAESPETIERLVSSGLEHAPLGPGSLTWKYFGLTLTLPLTQRTAVLQAMHPAISAGLLDHSDVFDNPIGRLARSSGPILGVVFDRDPAATGSWVRDQHPTIRGTDEQGRSYHALDPDTYYWAHATFFEAQISTQDFFGTPLTRLEKEQLYAESVTWYARYGVSMRPVPRNYSEFERYWQHMFDEVLEPTRVARGSVRRLRRVPAPPGLPEALWKPIGPLAGAAGPWLTRMTLPEPAQRMFGFEITDRDRRGFRDLQRAARISWPLVPKRFKRLPRARVR